MLSKQLDVNVDKIKNSLRVDKNFDIIYRTIDLKKRKAAFFFIDGFVKDDIMEKVIEFLYSLDDTAFETVHKLMKSGIPYVEADICDSYEQITTQVLSGVVVLVADGLNQAIMIDCRTYPSRSVEEPWKDRVLRGSRDGFVETVISNMALIRRRIRDPQLSFEPYTIGERSKTDVILTYIADVADEKLVQKIRDKLNNIKVSSLTMNIQSLAECLLGRNIISPLPKYKYSERPDTAAASLYSGNIILIVDNSPAVMILPTSIFDVEEEADDYYFPPVVGTYLRLSRTVITITAMFLTPVWFLLMNYPDMIPSWLSFITISDEITVPILLQLILLEFAIDGLRLAAVNTPNMLSTPLSVIAGIVVGEYAVSSGWFNSESLLYTAVITLATYSQPSFEMGYAIKFFRLFNLLLTAIAGIWGFVIATIGGLLCIIYNKTVSGRCFLYPLIPFDGRMLIRKLIRLDIKKV